MSSPPSRPLAAGDQIGPYQLEAEIGRGGMGEVFRARDSRLGRVVAIKVILTRFAADPEFRRRFNHEARALSSLTHPNICALFDILEHEGRSCLVMEYVAGESLDRVQARGSLPTTEVLTIARQLASALAAAHEAGIIHRDLKPGNIMMTPFGLKVLDFGLAKRVATVDPASDTQLASGVTDHRQILGTPAYMSPEQTSGGPIDARSDVFAFGVILYELLAGRRPFHGATEVETMAAILRATPEPLSARRHALPRPLIDVVTRCLSKSPADRFASGRELLDALPAARSAAPAARTARRLAMALAGLIVISAAAYFWTQAQRASRARWVTDVAVPEIARLIQDDRGLAAIALFREAERSAPNSRALIRLSEGVMARPVRIDSSPPGATIYISDYGAAAGDDLAEWIRAGTTPLTVPDIPIWGYYRAHAVMAGYLTANAVFGGVDALMVEMQPENEAAAGMVWVPPMSTPSALGVPLPGFWLSRHEVTNAEFKRFVDAGGYQNPRYWKEPWVRDGRSLSGSEVAAAFRDATGRPGPSGWELSAFAPGSDRLPVTGVSWYEAAAYAEFVGQSLPSLHEWNRAAGISVNANILSLSNFGVTGPVPVGSRRGMSPFGSYDMAGNVKEWTATAIAHDRYVLGGGWGDPPYEFSGRDARPPASREPTIGFRTLKRAGPPVPGLLDPVPRVARTLPPQASDAEYSIYERLHRYESSPLDPRIERVVEDSPHWRRETVSFRAAYGDVRERVLAHVFLPRGATAPHHAVIVLGGATIMNALRRVEDFDYPFEFLVRSGRAVVIPAVSGTLERGPSPIVLPPSQERDRAIRWSADIGRTLEYLGTRTDIVAGQVGFYGISRGAVHGARLLALHPQFKAAVLSSGGLSLTQPAEVNSWHFAPRVHTPVLMVNGRFDFTFPLETSQRPLFDAFATREPHKNHMLYDGGHRNLVTRPDLIGEILDWFDRYLGPATPR